MKFLFRTLILHFLLFHISPHAGIFEETFEKIYSEDSFIKAQSEVLSASELQLKSEKLLFLPNLSLRASRSKDLMLKNESNSFSVNSRLNLYNGGASIASYKLAKSLKNLESLKLRKTSLERESIVLNFLLNFIKKSQVLKLYSKQERRYTNLIKRLESKYRLGHISKSRVNKVKVDLNTIKIKLISLKNNLEVIKINLSNIKDVNINVLTQWPWTVQKIEQALLSQKPTDFVFLDLEEGKELLNKSKSHSRLSRSQFLPKLNLNVSAVSEDLRFSKNETHFLGSIQLDIPVFEGLKRRSDYIMAKARENLVRTNYKFSLKEVLNTVKVLRLNLKNRILSLKLNSKNQEIQSLRVHSSSQNFLEGRLSLTEFIQDQDRYLNTSMMKIENDFQTHVEFMNYCHFVNKGFMKCLKL